MDTLKELQFKRNSNLEFYTTPIRSAIVLGLGGVGSHVATILCQFKELEHLIIFDDDVIEISNLNRTSYSYRDIGVSKVQAMNRIIKSKNICAYSYPINKKFCEETVVELIENDFFNRIYLGSDVKVFDCRDVDCQDYHLFDKFLMNRPQIIKMAYDGFSVTLDQEPEENIVQGQEGYSETPSHVLSSQLIAIVGVLSLSTSVNKVFDATTLTFNTYDVVNALYFARLLCKLGDFYPEMKNKMYSLVEKVGSRDAAEVIDAIYEKFVNGKEINENENMDGDNSNTEIIQ